MQTHPLRKLLLGIMNGDGIVEVGDYFDMQPLIFLVMGNLENNVSLSLYETVHENISTSRSDPSRG